MRDWNRVQIGVELTGHCDLRCKHCLRADLSTVVEFDLALFQELITQAQALGGPHFAFTGGEVTLHSRFFDFPSLVQQAGYTWHFVTNGHSFPKIRDELLSYRESLTGISFSLDGVTRAAHDALRGKGSFKRVMMAIALAVRDGWRVTVQAVLNPHNSDQVSEFEELARKLGVHTLMFAHTQPVERASRNDLTLSPERCRELDQQILQLATRSTLLILRSSGHYDPTPFAHCTTLRHLSFNVDCHGRLTFCCQLSGVPGAPSESDVIADLRDVPLVQAIRMHMTLANTVNDARLAYVTAPATREDPYKNFHCHFCLQRFGKLAHLDAPSKRRGGLPEARPRRLNLA